MAPKRPSARKKRKCLHPDEPADVAVPLLERYIAKSVGGGYSQLIPRKDVPPQPPMQVRCLQCGKDVPRLKKRSSPLLFPCRHKNVHGDWCDGHTVPGVATRFAPEVEPPPPKRRSAQDDVEPSDTPATADQDIDVRPTAYMQRLLKLATPVALDREGGGLTSRQTVSDSLNEELWHAGIVRHRLDTLQQQMYDWWWSDEMEHERILCMFISRRVGKTFGCAGFATEIALRRPGSRLHYGAATGKAVKEMLLPNFTELFATCPKELRPKVMPSGYVEYQNGSVVTLAGCEDTMKADRLRGPYTDGGFVDEAGYNPVLYYVVNSVLRPMTLNRRFSRLTVYSNAPRSPAHDIIAIRDRCEKRKAYFYASIYDSPRFTNEDIQEEAEALGGEESSDFQREFMARVVVDEKTAVVPEWTTREDRQWVIGNSFRARAAASGDPEHKVHEPLVRDLETPQFPSRLTVVYLDDAELAAILVLHWDSETGALWALGERDIYKPTNDVIAAEVTDLEQEIWQSAVTPDRVISSDVTQVGLEDDHDLECDGPPAEDLHEQVMALRLLVRRGELVVHPRCHGLISHLRAAVWDTSRTKFALPAREPREGMQYYGRFAYIGALMMGAVVIDRDYDPRPDRFAGVTLRTHLIKNRRRTYSDGGIAAMAERMERRKR